MHDGSNVLERQRTEFVLLEKVVKILLEQFKDKAGVVLVLETLVGADEVELVGILLTQTRQDVYLDLALTCVRRMVLQNLDGHHFVSAFLPALDNLKNQSFPSSRNSSEIL